MLKKCYQLITFLMVTPYEENKHLYKECIMVEKALLKQIVAALDPEFIKPFKNHVTNTIRISITDVCHCHACDRADHPVPDAGGSAHEGRLRCIDAWSIFGVAGTHPFEGG